MTNILEHPTAIRARAAKTNGAQPPRKQVLDAAWLRQLCLEAGADDVGFVAITRPELDDQRADILKVFPQTKTLISYVCRMNREPVRSVARSAANLEFHETTDLVNEVGHTIVRALEGQGVRALNPAAGFPMEMTDFPGKTWIVSHKPVAVAAGLGMMGIHRNVIHPKFGNFILLGTILVDRPIGAESRPLDYNPCLSCKLCVAACPVGAIGADGSFNFNSCYTHNYREFMSGFTDWVETVADSKSAVDYRKQVSDGESASMWQSLAFGPNYKAAYCMAVCPAGEDVIAPFLDDRKGFLEEMVKPLQQKVETIYVLPNSEAEAYVTKRFPHKRPKRIRNGLRPTSIKGFVTGLPLVFNKLAAAGKTLIYHFRFTGDEAMQVTVVIDKGALQVQEGLLGKADCQVTADSATWLAFLRKEQKLIGPLLRGKVRIKGSPRLLMTFGQMFGA